MMSSPYLENPGRLNDVIAAIQALAAYPYYKLDFAGWSKRISADENKADHWKRVFEEHPEFFRLDTDKLKASLVGRRQHKRRYDVDREEILNQQDTENHPNPNRLSRAPLSSDEIGMLINTAIELHSRAIAQKEERRWVTQFVPAILSLIGVVIGMALTHFSG